MFLLSSTVCTDTYFCKNSKVYPLMNIILIICLDLIMNLWYNRSLLRLGSWSMYCSSQYLPVLVGGFCRIIWVMSMIIFPLCIQSGFRKVCSRITKISLGKATEHYWNLVLKRNFTSMFILQLRNGWKDKLNSLTKSITRWTPWAVSQLFLTLR